MTLIDTLKNRLVESEGRKRHVYRCPTGHMTVGVGLNLERRDAPHLLAQVGAVYEDVFAGDVDLTDRQVDALLDVTAREAIAEASALDVGWCGLPLLAQAILADLVFNMGAHKVREFRRFLDAVRRRDWTSAAAELADSRWYRQVGLRARRIVEEVGSLGEV